MQPTERGQTVMADRVTNLQRKVGAALSGIHKTEAGSSQRSSSSLGAVSAGIWECGLRETASCSGIEMVCGAALRQSQTPASELYAIAWKGRHLSASRLRM